MTTLKLKQEDQFLSATYIIEHVMPRLRKKRPEKSCVYEPFLDLELYFAVEVGRCSYILTEMIMEREGLTPSFIKTVAHINTINKIRTFELQELICSDIQWETPELYVLSTEDRMYGAGPVMYSMYALNHLAIKLDTSRLFLLPSSIHEIIAMRAIEGEEERINEMIRMINRQEVAEEEQLSDHLYVFDAKEDMIYYDEEPGGVRHKIKPYELTLSDDDYEEFEGE